MRKLLINILLRLIKVKSITLSFEDYDNVSTKYIEDTIKNNGFVLLNKAGVEYYLNGFTLLSIERKEEKKINKIFIRHDIDSTISRKVKWTEIKLKVQDLHPTIKYFSKLK